MTSAPIAPIVCATAWLVLGMAGFAGAAPAPPVSRPVVVTTRPAPSAGIVPLTLDLEALKARLKATKAIGAFTKLSLKNKVDDLLDRFRKFYDGRATVTLAELRQSYNLLMMKVLSLLQDDDQPLATAIVASREAIWGLLANPKTFAALQS